MPSYAEPLSPKSRGEETKQNQSLPSPAAVFALLRHLNRSGVGFLPHANQEHIRQWLPQIMAANPAAAARPVAAAAKSMPVPKVPAPPTVALQRDPYREAKLPLAQRTLRLADIAGEIAACQRCQILCQQRKHTVPGEGHAVARVCFMGEAPGADEDASGRPFVGPAGKLLTKMIEACSFSRDDVFILNTIKCRPPGNRNPEPNEVENCRDYLERQLEVIQPEYIVCLGLVAAKALLQTTLSVGRLRGQFHDYRGSKVLVTYHPSYLLREPEIKKAAWADLQFLLRDMGIELPKKS